MTPTLLKHVPRLVAATYSTPLSVTGQFPFCGLPFRLDTYRGCRLGCSYCFARLRGGAAAPPQVRSADAGRIARVFEEATAASPGPQRGMIREFIGRRVPVHFGGMSDPFQPCERSHGVSLSLLRTFAKLKYPTVISTKADLVAQEPYLSALRALPFLVVQMSFSTSEDARAHLTERNAPPPTARLRAMEQLAKNGIPVTARWQPYIPGISEEPEEFVSRVSSAGAIHVGLEHLKLPVERENTYWRRLRRVFADGKDFHSWYEEQGAYREGREFVLPARAKLAVIQRVAACTRAAGLTYGAADTEFVHYSDTACCCSGVDQVPGFQNFYRHQIGYVLRGSRGGTANLNRLTREWAPSRSVDRFLNSRSRLGSRGDRLGTMQDHIATKWNDRRSPHHPTRFWGVTDTGQKSRSGDSIYSVTCSLPQATADTTSFGRGPGR